MEKNLLCADDSRIKIKMDLLAHFQYTALVEIMVNRNVEVKGMYNWHNIETERDIEFLMSTYGGFHDACIVSLSFQSGAFVDDVRTMHFGDAESRRLSVIFQCQWDPKTIEVQFLGLRQMHLVGWQDNYCCDISEAYLAFHGNLLPGNPKKVIVWSDTDWFDVSKINNTIHEPADTYIVANSMRWRIIGG